MLEFIILGEIPGTQATIDFFHILAVLIAGTSLGVLFILPKLKAQLRLKKTLARYFNDISI
jgi:hypothetical protein